MQEIMTHSLGETQTKALIPVADPVAVDTFGGRIHVEWNPQAAVTPLGQLPFFTDYLNVSGLFDEWVSSCPLPWTSPNAPTQIDVLGTVLLSVLSGHQRYAYINAFRGAVVPFQKIISKSTQLFLVLSIFPAMAYLKINREELGFASRPVFLKQLLRGDQDDE